ncbi:flagellar filament capping protein FliD [Metabacillus fastidiosus]|uniref:flagellar filament capping protein FliD n=1 Tax=Metabacillus fastidiosus TaxID=1458 RepID=UPI003D2D9550
MVNNMRLSGFSSGLDVNQIVTDLMKAERIPMNRVFQKKEWLQWQRDAYRDVNLQLDTFRKDHGNLRFQYNFTGYSATSSDSTVATVKAKGSAVAGTYDLKVTQMASVAMVTTTDAIMEGANKAKGTDKITSGAGATIVVENGKGQQAEIEITADMTYSALASKIANAVDSSGKSLGLRASFDDITSKFVISSKDMGADQKIIIYDKDPTKKFAGQILSGNTDAVAPGTVAATGKDTEIEFNGTVIKSASNTISAFGVDITLLKADSSTVQKITIKSDTDSIFNNIKKFVNDYNNLIDSFKTRTTEKRNRSFQPLTKEEREALSEKEAEKWDEQAKKGLLYNDPILREALGSLRNIFSRPVESIPNGNIRMLSSIGISTQRLGLDGKLEINEEKLRAAIANNPDEVMNLFTADDGIGTKFYDSVGKSIEKLNKKAGRIETQGADQSIISKDLKDLDDQLRNWTNRLSLTENRYWKQFTAMEKALAKMNEQSSSLMSMFS